MSITCDCSTEARLIFPCSGASDVGELSDRVARKLTKTARGKMYCLAGIGGGVSGIVESTRAASAILAIDGCPMHCAKNTLERAGFRGFVHVELTANGFRKGGSPVDEEAVTRAASICAQQLSGKEVTA